MSHSFARSIFCLACLAATLSLGRAARAQSVQGGPYVYTTSNGNNGNLIGVLDTAANAFSNPISLPPALTGSDVVVSGDESTIYVLDANNNNSTSYPLFSVVNAATNSLANLGSFDQGESSLALAPNGSTLYMTAGADVLALNPTTGAIEATIQTGPGASGVAVSPNGSTVYVANVGNNTVTPIQVGANSSEGAISVGLGLVGGIAIAPNGQTVYVTAYDAQNGVNYVVPINTATNRVEPAIALDAKNDTSSEATGLAISPNGQTLYVALAEPNLIAVVNTISGNVTQIALGDVSPAGLVISPDGQTLYVGTNQLTRVADDVGVLPINLADDTLGDVIPSHHTFLLAACSNGNALLASGLTFVANTSGALECTLPSGPTGSPGPIFTGGTLQFAGAGISSALPIELESRGGIFDADGNNATLSGSIAGPGGLTKIGLGTLTLSGQGTYSGSTNVEVGTLQAGAANAFSPNSDYTIAADAILDLNALDQIIGSLAGAGAVSLESATLSTGADNVSATFSGVISGSGGLIKIGGSAQTLSGADAYTGATDVQGGTLLVDGSLASSGVTVENGATLGGSGAIANAVTVANGGVLSPSAGGTPSTLTMGSLTLSGGAIVAYELGTANVIGGGANDLTNVTADLTLAGSLDVVNSGSFGLGAYRLFNYAGALTDDGLAIGSLPNSYSGLIQTAVPGQVNLVVTGPGALVQYWDGAITNGDGTIHGGAGTWDAVATNWTAPNGAINASWQGGFGIFAGTAATVTVAAPLSYQGLQFSSDGYGVTASAGGSLSPTGEAPIRVDAGVTATISAPIVGAGGLEKTDPGTLILSGANAYSGGTSVTDGILGVGSNSALGSGALTMEAGTTLQAEANVGLGNAVTLDGAATIDAQTNDLTLSGVLSDGASAGSFAKIGSGTLTLTGNNAFSGGVTISDGVVVGSTSSLGAGAIVDNASLVFDQTSDGAFAATISGSGSLAKQGSGTLTLAGVNTYSGASDIQAGTLIVDGSLASPVTVENGARLGGAGAIGGLTALAGATVAPGVVTPYSTLTIVGNASFAGGSIYAVRVNAAGQNDALAVSGVATLSGGTVSVAAAPGAYTPLSHFTLLTAAGGVIGQFPQLSAASLSQTFAFLSPALSYDGDDVYLGFTQTIPFAAVAATRNQAAVGPALQALGLGNALYDQVVGLNAAGARQAFDALSGEVYASAATAAYEDARLPREAILDRLSSPFDASSVDVSSGMNAAYPPSAAKDPFASQIAEPAYGVWGRSFGDWGENRSDGTATTLSRATGGFVLGEDAQVAGPGGGDWRFGAAEGFTSDDFSVAARASAGDLQTAFGALYAGASFGAADLRAGAIYEFNSLMSDRAISFAGFTQATQANADGATAQVFGEAGYRFQLSSLAPLGLQEAVLEPVFEAADVNVRQDPFRESGGGAALNGFAQTFNAPTTTLGLRAETALAGPLPLALRGFLGWQRAYGDLTPAALLAFQGAPQTFTVFGAPIDHNALAAEAGVAYALASGASLGLSYSGQYGPHATDNAIKGEFAVQF
jgi:fibronectin-binding autotransporter adhesin